MIPELGHFTLILAFLVAAIQGTLPLLGLMRGEASWLAIAKPAARLQCSLITAAFLALTYAHVTNDFTVLNVVEHSHSLKPMLYKIAGVWGNHEGSFLLWVLILAGFGAAISWRMDETPLQKMALAIQGLIGCGFIGFILLTSNPFMRIYPPPADGQDLNPLLQDFALAIHPPLLYMGYVGFSAAFSLAVGFLLTYKDTSAHTIQAFARLLRPWVLIAWSTLTFGILLGSWWAYYELGWGGFWFWDPVENASLMPWLAGTALLHSVIVAAARGLMLRWTLLLAILTFALSLLGTFLVRSGVLISVHAFASDPARGVWVLMLLAFFVGGALLIYGLRSPAGLPAADFMPLSRETMMLLNNLFMLCACGTVVLGTIYPLLLAALRLDSITVGGPYFMATCVPLFFPVLLLMGLAPMMAWQEAMLKPLLKPLRLAMIITVIALLTALLLLRERQWFGLLTGTLGVWVIAVSAADALRSIKRPSESWAKLVAHAAFGIAVLGMSGSFWSSEKIVPLTAGEKLNFAGYDLQFDGVEPVAGPNYVAEQAHLQVWQQGRFVTTMHPARRAYPVSTMRTTEAAIITNGLADLYVTLGEPLDKGDEHNLASRWSLRLVYQPLAPWIWLGPTLMGLAGLVSLYHSRRKNSATLTSR